MTFAVQKIIIMFTIEQIKAAHAKVKSGKDFPAYIQDLIAFGVTGYSTFVSDGHTDFNGTNNYVVQWPARYALLPIAAAGNTEKLKHNLIVHQQGQTDYPTFCRQAGEAGVVKWTVDTQAMTCTYYDVAGDAMLVEAIPGA